MVQETCEEHHQQHAGDGHHKPAEARRDVEVEELAHVATDKTRGERLEADDGIKDVDRQRIAADPDERPAPRAPAEHQQCRCGLGR